MNVFFILNYYKHLTTRNNVCVSHNKELHIVSAGTHFLLQCSVYQDEIWRKVCFYNFQINKSSLSVTISLFKKIDIN